MNVSQHKEFTDQTKAFAGESHDSGTQVTDQSELLISLTTDDAPYLCPGETLPINRSVHLARLRSHYRKCKQCPHRLESEQFSSDAYHQLEQWWNFQEKTPEALRDGFAGRSPNEFPTRSGRALSQTFATMQWEHNIERKQSHEDGSPADFRPTIVMGHDFSETSLEMMRESVRGVREQGCNIIDVGGVTPACMKFALEHLQADAGIHVSACRVDSFGVGLDFYGPDAIPLSGESLYEVQTCIDQKQYQRFSRSDGGLTPFPARKAYLGSLWKQFRGIRPFRLWVNTPNELIVDLLTELFEDLPGTLIINRKNFPFTPHAPVDRKQLRHLGNDLIEQECEIGIILDSQGQSCLFFDKKGDQIPASEILGLLYQQIESVHSSGSQSASLVMLGEELQDEEITWDFVQNNIFRHRQSLREYFTRGMATAKTPLGYDASHRYWFADPVPICDGIVTLGKVLQAITNDPGYWDRVAQ